MEAVGCWLSVKRLLRKRHEKNGIFNCGGFVQVARLPTYWSVLGSV